MKLFKDRKGFTNPGYMFVYGVVAGLILAYLWIKYTNIPNPYV